MSTTPPQPPERPSLRHLLHVQQVVAAFSEPMPGLPAMPDGLQPLVRAIAAWDARARAAWERYDESSVYRRALEIGVCIGDSLRFIRGVRTRRIDAWLAGAADGEAAAFEAWRDAFFLRCDALAALTTEGLVATNLAMPEDGMAAMTLGNPVRIARVISGRDGPLSAVRSTLGLLAAAPVLVAREREFFGGLILRQMRRAGVPVGTFAAARAMRRLNARAGRTLLTHRHTEPLIAAYRELRERGVAGRPADAIVLRALELAEETSGKPWKGLTRLYEVLVYSGDDPRAPGWDAVFTAAMTGAAEYTHVPGREWIVRDYGLGKRLMQLDGKIAPGDRWAGIQQGRGSLATGYLRGGQDRTAFADRYSKPYQAFNDSMVVAEGPDHQRQRRAFLPFFSQGALLSHAPFVERTVSELLDHAAGIAARNGGRFDFRTDFAYRFPIRVICEVLGLPEEDVPRVQHWAEASVRSLDSEAGVDFETAVTGQRASDEFRAYLDAKLAAARAGTFGGHVIRTVAADPTLSEAERVANLGVLVFAGFETTTGLLSRGVETLLRHREQWEHLRAGLVAGPPAAVDGEPVPDREWRWLAWAHGQPERTVDRERRDRLDALRARSADAAARFEAVHAQEVMLDHAVEEMLRWTAPGTVVPLTASKEIEVPLETDLVIKGCPYAAGETLTIERGETIAVAVDELNRRCPVGAGRFAGDTPTRFDVTREENTAHLSFGLRHSCIGAFLAKENAKRALEGVLRRFPDLEIAGVPIPQEMEMFSGLASLPVRTRLAGGLS
ncbi:MAG TPA: hypothetical protein VF263_18540 [Longimicrobiaceae bacterium]